MTCHRTGYDTYAIQMLATMHINNCTKCKQENSFYDDVLCMLLLYRFALNIFPVENGG